MIDFKNGIEIETDDLPEHERQEEANKKHRKVKKFFTYFGIILIIILIFAAKIITSGNGGSWFGNGFLGTLSHIATSGDKKLIGQDDDRINILLLGIGGKNHDGGNLTDTIMLVSIKPSTKQAAFISIPRDLVVPVDGSSSWKKINSINAMAEAREPGSGGTATAKALSDLLGTPITYYVRVDFEGFTNIIDDMGGVTVNVENTLDDYAYPVLGEEDNPSYYARYEHLHVDAGEQTMDGSLALKFARSRHGVGKEGSDFARARRQQLILQAVKSKLLSGSTLLKPAMVVKIINELNEHVSTNMSVTDMLSAWDLYKEVDQANVINKVLDNSAAGLLVNQTGYDGAYTLVPRTGNFREIQNFVENIFNTTAPAAPVKALGSSVSLQVVNGTWVSGLANKIGTKLEPYNFNVTRSNGSERNFTTSAIYDLSNGENAAAIKTLTSITGASVAYDNPAWLEKIKASGAAPSLVLLLGTDAENWTIQSPQQ